jgi:hypothetical protein
VDSHPDDEVGGHLGRREGESGQRQLAHDRAAHARVGIGEREEQ